MCRTIRHHMAAFDCRQILHANSSPKFQSARLSPCNSDTRRLTNQQEEILVGRITPCVPYTSPNWWGVTDCLLRRMRAGVSRLFLNPNCPFAHPKGNLCKQITSAHHSLLRPSNHLCPPKSRGPPGPAWLSLFSPWWQSARYSCSSSLKPRLPRQF